MSPLGRRAAGPGARSFLAAPRADAGTPWREAEWCAVDLELTGLDPRHDHIIAIGAVPIVDGRLILGSAYYTLVRAGRAPGPASVVIHKLRSIDLAGAPTVGPAIDGLLAVMAGRVPVFHTAWVEETFLGRALRRRRARLPAAADTEILGRRWLAARGGPVPVNVGLTQIAERLGLPAEDPHHALGDALTTAKAFIALATLLDAAEPQNVGSLTSSSSTAS